MSTLQQQKEQIDYDARKTKDAADAEAYEARQVFAASEIKRVRWEAEELVKQIQYDAKK